MSIPIVAVKKYALVECGSRSYLVYPCQRPAFYNLYLTYFPHYACAASRKMILGAPMSTVGLPEMLTIYGPLRLHVHFSRALRYSMESKYSPSVDILHNACPVATPTRHRRPATHARFAEHDDTDLDDDDELETPNHSWCYYCGIRDRDSDTAHYIDCVNFEKERKSEQKEKKQQKKAKKRKRRSSRKPIEKKSKSAPPPPPPTQPFVPSTPEIDLIPLVAHRPLGRQCEHLMCSVVCTHDIEGINDSQLFKSIF